MPKSSYFFQALFYLMLMSVLGYCSNLPKYKHLPENSATIKMSLRHSGQLLGECRERTKEELLQLPANMRAPKICPRERSALLIELRLDNEMFHRVLVPPSGLSGDGMASFYKRFSVPAGTHKIDVRMKDHVDSEVYAYQRSETLSLDEESVLVIDFKAGEQGFIFL